MWLCDSVLTDIDTGRSLEQQVHETEQLAFVHDSVRIVHISAALAGFLGYRVDEMEGRLLVSFVSASAFVAMIQAISKNRVLKMLGKTQGFEPRPTCLKNKHGEEVVLKALCSIDIPTESSTRKKVRLTVLASV